MTKVQAKNELKKGKKLTHRFFTKGEWVISKHGMYQFEDGVHCTPDLFWLDRTGIYWEKDWQHWSESE